MEPKKFCILFRWELEKNLSLPVLTFLIVSALIVVLAQTNSSVLSDRNFLNLYFGSGNVFYILTIVASAFLSRSFAGSIEKGELNLLLSYPIKRWEIFISKFTTIFITIFIVYSVAFSLRIYLYLLSPYDPLFYLSLFAFFLHLLLVSGVSITVSIITKNEVMSLAASILLLLGLESAAGTSIYLSSQGRFLYLFQYFGKITRGILPFGEEIIVTTNDVAIAIFIPILIFLVLFFLSFIYLTRAMEFD